MYASLSNRLLATVIVFGLLLQSCGSSFQINSEEFPLEASSKTDDDVRFINQTLVPGAQSSVPSDVSHSEPLTATTLLSVATSAVPVTLPTYYLAVGSNTVSSREKASSTESEETDTKPAAQAAEYSLVCFSTSLCASPFSVPAPVFGVWEWARYFGEVGVAPPLPSDINEILDSPCPFWPEKVVKETHLLVLIPSTVDGEAFTLDLLEELIQDPRGNGHRTRYFLYDDEVQRSSGDVYSSSSYWVLFPRDILPGSSNKPYEAQQVLVAQQSSSIDHSPYEIPNVLEAATTILLHYVRSGDRLYAGGSDALPSTSTRCTALLEDTSEHPSPVTVGRFCSRGLVFLSGFDDDVESGISCLRRFGIRHYRPSALLHSFGTEEWNRYLGAVEATPPLPVDIVDILNSACPFWPRKRVRDTHLLVLIPATVNGKPFSLNLLGELIQDPQGGGHPTEYDDYDSDLHEQFGTQSPRRPYWVLMTRDVIESSRRKAYTSQQVLVACHANRTGLPYELPSALEATTAILSNYVRSGERLYADNPWTWTRCQDLVAWCGSHYPAVVGGFSSGGLNVYYFSPVISNYGVAGLRKF
jgi:hypothetical protein